jgi:succinate dehydrogenase / fumarate reductase cytochrome b subunit
MNPKRPVNLELSTIHFPITAITSIMHRLSGIAIFLLLPLMLYLLQESLASAESYNHLQVLLQQPILKLMLWFFVSALFYHFMAGVRHMVSDLGWGEEVKTSRISAIILLLLTVVSTAILGVWIW